MFRQGRSLAKSRPARQRCCVCSAPPESSPAWSSQRSRRLRGRASAWRWRSGCCTPPKRSPRDQKGTSGRFRCNLHATNGKAIATSEAYETKRACLAGVESVPGTTRSVDALR